MAMISEQQQLAVLSLAILAALAFISKKIFQDSKSRRLPPGPRPWPIIGNLHQLGALPHLTIDRLAQKYGDIMQLKYGLKTVVVATSPRMAEEFLKLHDHVFASRPPFICGHYLGCDYQDLTWAPPGPHWRKGRKIYVTDLLSVKMLDSFKSIRLEERHAFFSRLYAQRGNPMVLREQIRRYTLSSVYRMVFGNKYSFGGSEKDSSPVVSFEELDSMIDELFVLDGVLNIGDWIPWLRLFDLQGHVKRMKILRDKFERLHNRVIADHMATMKDDKNFTPKDMLDVVLQFTRDDANPEMKLTLHAAKAVVHDLLPASSDTTGATIEWAISELLRHPHVIKKAKEELDRAIGRERWVQEDDYPQLPYIDAVIKETFRLHPLTPLLPRYTREDCNVAGYDIAKGTTVLISAWSTGRHPNIYEAPHEFKPERFIGGKEIPMTGQDFSLLPFGSGRRMCPGYRLGLKVVRTTLSNLLHGFDWKLPEGMKPEDICMVERCGLTICPRVPVTVILEPRFPAHFYQ